MDLLQSVQLSQMRYSPNPGVAPRTKPVEQIAQMMASVRHPEEWLASGDFILMDLPIHFATIPIQSHPNDVLSAMRASAGGNDTVVVVDLNKRGCCQTKTGYVPSVLVINGQAGVEGARLAGRETVRAWVGRLAAQKLKLIHAERQPVIHAGVREHMQTDKDGQMSCKLCGESVPHPRGAAAHLAVHHRKELEADTAQPFPNAPRRGMNIENAAKLYGGGASSSLGNGSGPPPDSGLGITNMTRGTTTPTAMKAKKKMAALAETEETGKAVTQHRGASNSEMRKRFEDGVEGTGFKRHGFSHHGGHAMKAPKKPTPNWDPAARWHPKGFKGAAYFEAGLKGSGYYGYPGATEEQRKKFKGATNSEMAPQLSAAGISKIVAEYQAAVSAGYKIGKIRTVAPPGMEHMVLGLKKKFGEKSSAPFRIAWWRHGQNQKKSKMAAASIQLRQVWW